MKLRIGSGYFTPRLVPTLLTLVMLPVLLGLGTWQLHRLHWKEQLLATIDRRSHDDPLEIPYVSLPNADYRPAMASGIFRHDLTFFVFSSDKESGKGGYHVMTPLELAKGSFLLVDRGWIPYERKDQADGLLRPTGQVYIKGIMRVPERPGFMQPKNDPAKSYWYSVDLVAMASTDHLDKLLPYILEADDAVNDGGYPVGGQTRLTLPNDHFQYALTWYGMALILLVIYGVSGWKKTAED